MKERAINVAMTKRRARIDAAEREAENKLSAALSIPEISAAHTLYVDKKFNNILNGKNPDEVTAARDKYLSALSKYGYSESEFEYTPLCPVCKDRGSVNGRACDCVWEEYISCLKDECNILAKAPFTFGDCDTSVISEEAQRATLERLYKHMSAYADKLPDVNYKNIVLSGTVGSGKTCLASAVARAAVERGKSCKFMSAYEFNNEMLACHTSPISERSERLHDVLTADLLVIDDLGTEPILKNVTIEYLLLTLEERLNAELCTLITTNLDEDGIMSRYFERIYSRLGDKRHSRFFKLSGKDLRQA